MAEIVLLKEFVLWLLDRNPGLSQIEVARRAGVSQSVIQKYVKGTTIKKYGDLDTYKRVLAAYTVEWLEYLKSQPQVVTQLQNDFPWVLVAARLQGGGESAVNEDVEEAYRHVAAILSAPGTDHGMFLEQLRAQATYVSHAQVRGEPVLEGPRRRTDRRHRPPDTVRDAQRG